MYVSRTMTSFEGTQVKEWLQVVFGDNCKTNIIMKNKHSRVGDVDGLLDLSSDVSIRLSCGRRNFSSVLSLDNWTEIALTWSAHGLVVVLAEHLVLGLCAVIDLANIHQLVQVLDAVRQRPYPVIPQRLWLKIPHFQDPCVTKINSTKAEIEEMTSYDWNIAGINISGLSR